MEFEWDEAKRLENLRRRNVDFSVAAQIFKGPVLIREDRRFEYGERRHRAIGQFEGKTYVVAYTLRGEICRFITAWQVSQAGERRYKAIFARGSGGDA
jgi:uncharacterized DUF497 family protein